MSKKPRTADQTIPTIPPDVLDLPKARPSEVGLDKVTIDPKFANLLDPGDEKALLKLYEEIERDGFRDPIVAARLPDGSLILIDGHHRYRIWKKYYKCDPARAPQVVVIDFPDRESAELWIIRNQMCRRNIIPAQKIALVVKFEPLIAAKAEENRKRGVCLKSDEGQTSIDTNSVRGESVTRSQGISGGTIFGSRAARTFGYGQHHQLLLLFPASRTQSRDVQF